MNHNAIYNTHPAVVSIDDSVGCLDKDGNEVVLDETLIQAEVQRLQAEYDSNQYQRDRASEYPSFGEQLDYIYHNGVEAWKTDIIDPIKSKYPKE